MLIREHTEYAIKTVAQMRSVQRPPTNNAAVERRTTRKPTAAAMTNADIFIPERRKRIFNKFGCSFIKDTQCRPTHRLAVNATSNVWKKDTARIGRTIKRTESALIFIICYISIIKRPGPISQAAPIGDSLQAGLSFEQQRGELAEIDAPVAPDVAAGGLYVGIFITSVIEFLAEVGVGLIEKVILSDADPEK